MGTLHKVWHMGNSWPPAASSWPLPCIGGETEAQKGRGFVHGHRLKARLGLEAKVLVRPDPAGLDGQGQEQAGTSSGRAAWRTALSHSCSILEVSFC